jgi:exodeoxyribonuclease-3
MRLLTWNIRHGGGTRLPRIQAALARHSADIVVLTEYRGGDIGTRLRGELELLGYRHTTAVVPPARQNGVLIAAKRPFRSHGMLSNRVPEPHRMVEVEFPSFRLTGVYLPNQAKKVPYWDEIVAASAARAHERALVMGDFNTTRHYLDEAGALCVTSRYMDEMEQIGFCDVWRHHHPDRREYSWFSTKGNGFRLDHAFCSRTLTSHAAGVHYSHDERRAGVSDHSLLVTDLRDPRRAGRSRAGSRRTDRPKVQGPGR